MIKVLKASFYLAVLSIVGAKLGELLAASRDEGYIMRVRKRIKTLLRRTEKAGRFGLESGIQAC